MKTIQLTKGYVATVDDDDFGELSKFPWNVLESDGSVYAIRRESLTRRAVLMHRAILQPPDELIVDHRDGNGLNNTRENLRSCTHAQNMQNQVANVTGASRFKGVNWDKRGYKHWRAQITCNGKQMTLGRFADELSAALCYDAAAREFHGEFARPNFPDSKLGVDSSATCGVVT